MMRKTSVECFFQPIEQKMSWVILNHIVGVLGPQKTLVTTIGNPKVAMLCGFYHLVF